MFSELSSDSWVIISSEFGYSFVLIFKEYLPKSLLWAMHDRRFCRLYNLIIQMRPSGHSLIFSIRKEKVGKCVMKYLGYKYMIDIAITGKNQT